MPEPIVSSNSGTEVPGPSRQPRQADKPGQILAAAQSVVMEGGFASLQMTAVAAAAGIAVGTIYRYYPSRADLCAAIVSSTSQRELDVICAIEASDASPSDKLRDGVRTFVARAMQGRRLAYGLIFEPIDPTVETTRLYYRRAIADVFEQIIRKGIAVGEFRSLDPAVAATCTVGAFMEGLIGTLAPDAEGAPGCEHARSAEIAEYCLAGVSA
ncbi:TetR/AcrR family transcriptional regulator [Paracoccus sp. M683]|uniref:TetR/AcrR family transcriptional regulator n=1 Tax=Paracoccus sp. M683 TaxID=2594268 RepID=UPI00117E957E|nr:TetR/AcrR family transcriptional regulator [Paracoccus sp. M683]TRW94864.1 TetR/AcrR family transcriptional regulator [Paracoccus sp. M683]